MCKGSKRSILSFKPEVYEKIKSGKKKFEHRRNFPDEPIMAYMYVSAPIKAIKVTVKMTNFNTIIDDIFPLADKTEYINALASYQLLIIDDLGVERNSEYALGIIFSVIDRRIRSGRPLIITTNLPLKEIKSETMLDKRRIYDRILEMCTPMYVGGTSKREAIASMKMEKAKTLLNTNRGEEKCE